MVPPVMMTVMMEARGDVVRVARSVVPVDTRAGDVHDLRLFVVVAIGVMMVMLNNDAFPFDDPRALNIRFAFFIAAEICGGGRAGHQPGKCDSTNGKQGRLHGKWLRW